MAVALRVASARGRPFGRALRADAAGLLAAMELGRCELSIVIVDDDTIRELNREFRGRDQPTDVLSFSQLEERGGAAPDVDKIRNARGTLLGDVVISIDTALRQASEYNVTPAARLRTLIIHGVLHLVGYDHERSVVEARRMFARERALAAALKRDRPASEVRRAKGERGRGRKAAR